MAPSFPWDAQQAATPAWTQAGIGATLAPDEGDRAMPDWLPQETIRRKRDGHTLSDTEIARLIAALADGTLAESQAAAFAMAVFLRGMEAAETVALTRAMRDSGTVLDWRALDVRGPVIDKHSTGGIGDKVSLILAPLLAACGAFVPMISGRGLGHTGGTLDKLAALPGYRTDIDLATFARVVRDVGCAVIGQTADLAPADRRLYAIRDVTATVESLPLITASILSKKLAEGLDALVLDVKCGSGAFMPDLDAARALARSLVTVARGAGLAAAALITGMDQALGRSVGNALEVAEAIAFLTGAARDARLSEVTLALAAAALVLAGLAPDEPAARRLAAARLADGSAAERFARMVAALGGPADALAHPALPPAPCVVPAYPTQPGVVAAIDGRALGLAVIALGGGRTRADQPIDPRVGLAAVAGIGERVDAARPLCLIHATDPAAAAGAVERVRAAVTIDEAAPAPAPPVRERLG
jgi:thymidine phosphorylase